MGCIYSKTDNGDIETTTEAYECLDKVRHCDKNPGHEQFYSLAELTVDILPEGCRTKQLLDYIRFFSKLVVRLTVYKSDGSRLHGTGYVLKDCYSDKLCIRTNHHVVGSQEDVSNCHIDFYYDTVDKTGIVTSKGVKLYKCNKKWDLCIFTINPVPQTIKDLISELKSIYLPPKTHSENIIAISHPHGGPKMVTIGEWLGYNKDDDGVGKGVHTARTCPGASGCPLLNTSRVCRWDRRYGWNYYTHYAGKRRGKYKGRHSDTLNVNYSVYSYLYLTDIFNGIDYKTLNVNYSVLDLLLLD